MSLDEIIKRDRERRQRDAHAYRALDKDRCMLCQAYGPDKRSLRIGCLYAVHEVVPEALDLHEVDGSHLYYVNICKHCRGMLLAKLSVWRNECIAKRGMPMDEDGGPMELTEGYIPVREHGAIRHLTREEWESRQ